MKVLYPAKKEKTQEITDNSPKETHEMDASEKNAERPKQPESANASSAINTYDQVSVPAPDSTVREKEPPKKNPGNAVISPSVSSPLYVLTLFSAARFFIIYEDTGIHGLSGPSAVLSIHRKVMQ